MFKPTISILAACLLAAACTSGAQEDPLEPTRGVAIESPKAPDFTGITHWINSPALSLEQLRGKVVLVEFWTYDCINCIHVLPHSSTGTNATRIRDWSWSESTHPSTVTSASSATWKKP